MKKASSWYVAKLKLIHKQTGYDALRDAYKTSCPTKRDWFRGYFTFQSFVDVKQRFNRGQPLSGFLVDNDATRLNVAFNHNIASTMVQEEGHYDMFYITLKCVPSTMHMKETGVHFCRFEFDGVVHTARKRELNINNYALMLPYMHKDRRGIPFQMQYTVIYYDWEVLRCDFPNNPKGLLSTKNRLFDNQ